MRKYDEYVARMGKIADFYHAIGLLHWDTEVMMPKGGSAARSRQIATVSGHAHELFTDKVIGELLDAALAENDISEDERRNLELTKEDYEKQMMM